MDPTYSQASLFCTTNLTTKVVSNAGEPIILLYLQGAPPKQSSSACGSDNGCICLCEKERVIFLNHRDFEGEGGILSIAINLVRLSIHEIVSRALAIGQILFKRTLTVA